MCFFGAFCGIVSYFLNKTLNFPTIPGAFLIDNDLCVYFEQQRSANDYVINDWNGKNVCVCKYRMNILKWLTKYNNGRMDTIQ